MTPIEQYEALTQQIKSTADLTTKKALLQELYHLVDNFSDFEREKVFHNISVSSINEIIPLEAKIAAAGLPTFSEFYSSTSVPH